MIARHEIIRQALFSENGLDDRNQRDARLKYSMVELWW